jgi:general secretion pathway protein N
MRLVWAIAGAVFLLALIVLTPLRMALGWTNADAAGLTAGRVEGTVWSGRLHDAGFRGVALGDVGAGLDPLGRGLQLAVSGDVEGRGRVKLRKGGLGLSGLDATLPLSRIAPTLPFDGALSLDGLSLDMRDGSCRSAAGRVSVEAVTVRGVERPIPGLILTGRAACQGGRVTVPLAGAGGGVAVDVALSFDGAGGYEALTRARATDPAALAALSAGGFERGLDGFTRTDGGRLGAGR